MSCIRLWLCEFEMYKIVRAWWREFQLIALRCEIALRNWILITLPNIVSWCKNTRRWCSGIMQDSHSCDPGSIPGRRIAFGSRIKRPLRYFRIEMALWCICFSSPDVKAQVICFVVFYIYNSLWQISPT